jgi:hypothetical protein
MPKYELFEKWQREKATVRADFVSGNISVTFTGRVVYHSPTELRLARLKQTTLGHHTNEA